MPQLSLSIESSLLVRDVAGEYRPANADEVLQAALRLLGEGGWIYLEADRPFDESACAALGLTLHRHGRAGMVHYHLLKLHP